MVDVSVQLQAPLAVDSDTPVHTRLGTGGGAAGTAAWLARGGHPVRLVAAMGLFVAAFGFASLYFELITPAIVIGCLGLYMARTSPLIRAGADVPARRATRSLPTA